MIQIKKKPSDTPAILKTVGAEEIRKLKRFTKSERISYKYKSAVYGHPTVKKKLKKLQHDKCCFCEATVSHVAHGDVEHYRPKAGYIQVEKEKLNKPGYYWLAYDFANLFLSCQLCNQVYKRNYFPLANPAKRAKLHSAPITAERPLIVNPGKDDPSKYITYVDILATPVKNNPIGIETIKRTGLNRAELKKQRFEFLQTLKILSKVVKLKTPEAKEARAHFKKLGKSSSEFSMMVRANFKSLV